MNTGGSRLLEELGSLRADVKSLQSNVEKHEARFEALLDVRKRAFLTWLRDFWRDHGAGSKAGPSMHFKARIQSPNHSIIHGGYAIMDALIVKQKGLPYEEEFTEMYGISPSEVEYIGNVAFILPEELPISILLIPILAAKQYNAILQALNAIGTFRFAGWYLRKPEKEIYDKVVMLARKRSWEEAEQAATDFPRW